MTVPFFYIDKYDGTESLQLNEETSKHVIQVLRMVIGEKINLTDGKGNLLHCEIVYDHKKNCTVRALNSTYQEAPGNKVIVAMSLLKNAARFEWFLEKATEIGITEIIPLLCKRTERERFRYERMNGICISAMLQSQQVWLPVLHEPAEFGQIEKWKIEKGSNLIAHCNEGEKQVVSNFHISKSANTLICIGPEGDFSNEEIEMAIQHSFIPVSLGETRLRTETAGIAAAVLLKIN
jgi:16S rRNA (uracil1498-N3)-methyltransferase